MVLSQGGAEVTLGAMGDCMRGGGASSFGGRVPTSWLTAGGRSWAQVSTRARTSCLLLVFPRKILGLTGQRGLVDFDDSESSSVNIHVGPHSRKSRGTYGG